MAFKGIYQLKHPEKYMGNENPTWRSLWERRVFLDMEDNDRVLKWGSECLAIPYVSPKDMRVHKYFPDLLVKYLNNDGSITYFIVEIKPKRETVPPVAGKRKRKTTILREHITFAINSAKWDAARLFCSKKGMKFITLTEESLDFFKP